MKRKCISLLIVVTAFAALVFLPGLGLTSYAANDDNCRYLRGSNVGANNYLRFSSPSCSSLTTYGDGYMRVQGNTDDGVTAVYYDSDFKLVSRKVITGGLNIFGGFYESSGNYYIVSGQSNPNENDSVEVYRIAKYDKSWNLLGTCGLYGANTYIPFDAGGCSIAMDGKYLIVRTCHEMYLSNDGYHHQANVTIEVDTDKMEITDSHYTVANAYAGYVSHSFNQKVRIVDHHIVSVDHGDAYPRSMVLMYYPTDVTTGSFYSYNVKSTTILELPGNIGDNTTGSSLGAFELSSTSYLVAGNSVFKDSSDVTLLGNKTRNIFVAAVNQSTKNVAMTWLTDLAEGDTTATTPHMVRITDNKFMVLWTEGTKVGIAFVDGNGNKLGETSYFEGSLSDCVPLVKDGKVIWYTWNNAIETFYSVSADDPSSPVIVKANYDHDYTHQKTENGLATLVCTKCGVVTTGKVPTDFTAYWRKSSSTGYYYSVTSMEIDDGDGAAYLLSGISYSAESDNTFADFTVTSNDPENTVITASSGTMGNIQFSKSGTYTITISPKYNPDVKRTCTIYVIKALNSVSFSASPASPQKYGTEITLSAEADGGKGNISYKFIAAKAGGDEQILQEGSDSTCAWTPSSPGTYTLHAEASDSADPGTVVTSDSFTFVVSKADAPAILPSAEYGVPFSMSALSNDILTEAPGWEFSTSDLGTELTIGERQVFTAYYVADDRDNYETVTAEVGVTRSSCSHDGETEVRDAVESSCTAEGYSGDTYCKLCGELISSGTNIPLKAHDTAFVEAKDPTYSETGNIAYWECSSCHKKFTDKAGTDEITTDVVIPVLERTSIDSAEISAIVDQVYSGAPIKPALTVTLGDITLNEGTDYTVAYSDNTKVGVASVTVSGTGGYKGSVTTSFNIFPQGTEIAELTPELKAFTVTWNKKEAEVAGYLLEYSTDSDFASGITLTITDNTTTTASVTDLPPNKQYHVRIRTYQTAGDSTYYSAWSSPLAVTTLGHEHPLTKTAAVPPTCTEPGNSEYWTCSECDMYFKDENGTVQIDKDSWILPASGHDFGSWTKLDDDKHQRVCRHDSSHKEQAAHSWDDGVITTAPTCTTSGVKMFTCKDCRATKTETIPAPGHSLTEHKETAPTCAKAGNTAYWSCDRCGTCFSDADGKTVIDKNSCLIPATSHSYSGWTTTTEATEQAEGLQTRTCSKCGDTQTQKLAQLAPTLSSVKIAKPKAGKKSVTAKWKKISKKNQKTIKKIEIQVSTDPNFGTVAKTKLASSKKTSAKISGLQKGTKYYIRIRSYTDGHVSAWSTSKSFKAK